MQLWQGLGIGKVEQILLDARAALNIHPEQQVGATYLAEQTPTIAGVVEDETPTRKDRTRLSCRASDFDGINQRFYGGNTSTSKTQLSASVWIRPDVISGVGAIFGEYASAADRGWLFDRSGDDLQIIISQDGGNTNWKLYRVLSLFSVGEWLHVAFTFDLDVGGGVNELLVYVDGKEVTPTKTADVNLTAIFDTTASIDVARQSSSYFDGQIQQPLIYEGVWTPAQVRDIYLQKTDASITYGWFLDADTAHPLTSASPTLTPANSPAIYEDDAIGGGDWLNEKGWNNSGTLAPKRWDEELDSLGNVATDSNSFGTARRDGQLRDGPCFSFGGTEYATNGNLVGTETVVSSEGTSTPTISSGRIDFTAGTCWNLLLSNGSHYAGWHDDVNDEHLTFFNSPNWSTQDSYFWNENKGYSLYEHASEPDLFVPLKSDGTALTITPPSGYTKTSDNPAGPWLYEGDATYVDFDVVSNANQWLEQRWQESEFNNTTSKIAIPALMTGATSLEIEAVVKSGDVNAYRVIYGQDASQAKVLIRITNTGTVNVFLNNGAVNLTGSTVIDDDEWHTVKAVYDGVDVRIFVDGVLDVTPFAFTSPITTYTHDDFIGQWNGSQSFDGEIKNLTATKDGVLVLDVPLLGTSLDLSQVNHGTDTDITYNRLTDTSYTAGDVVEQPFSVNDDTSGRVSELIQFTFPVTTLSSTPTISQTVFEDGNTVTQDGILISES
jgi:hypothetical protein